MSKALWPRLANAAARLMAVVVLPTPPFWLTTASTWPTLFVGRRRFLFPAHRRERFLGVPHPAIRLGSRRRFGEERLQVVRARGRVASLDEQEGEAVVR